MAEGIDLRKLLEQDRQQVYEFLETSRRLVIEIRCSNHWVKEACAAFASLENIGDNLTRLLALCEPGYGEGSALFARPEAKKAWNTAYGLHRAMGPLTLKFNDHVDKRRRQRIMGEEFSELPDVTVEEIEGNLERFNQLHAKVWSLFDGLGPAINAVPAGLFPDAQAMQGSPNGQVQGAPAAAGTAVAAAPAPQMSSPTAPPQPPVPKLGADDGENGPDAAAAGSGAPKVNL